LFVCVCALSGDCFVLFGIVLCAWRFKGISLSGLLSLWGTTHVAILFYMAYQDLQNFWACQQNHGTNKLNLLGCGLSMYINTPNTHTQTEYNTQGGFFLKTDMFLTSFKNPGSLTSEHLLTSQ